MLFMLLKLIPHTKGPTLKPSPHVPFELFSVQHTALHTPNPLSGLISFHSSALARGPFSPPYLSYLHLLVVAQCYFLQDVPWPRAGVNTSAQGLATCCLFFLPLRLPRALERAGCLSITPTGHRIALSGQEFSLCFPSTQ